MATVALLGTLDTKGEEYSWLKDRLEDLGVQVLSVDVGSFSASPLADVSSDEVIAAAGAEAAVLRQRRDRGEMMTVMGQGAAKVLHGLAAEGRIKPMLHLGLPDYYVEHAKPADMLAECGLNAAGIEASIRQRLALLEQNSR